MAPQTFDFSQPNATFSGCDMSVSLLFPDAKPIFLGDCATLSYSTWRDRAPIRTLGRIGPKGYTKGYRTIAGTIVFTLFDKSAVNRIKEQLEYMRDIGTILPDELPPFDLVVTMANEYGASARLRIYGVAVHEEGMTLSVEDLFTENIWSYQARALKPLDTPDLREGDHLDSSFVFDDSEVAGRFVIADLQGSRESIALRVALDTYKARQEQFLGEAVAVGVDFVDVEGGTRSALLAEVKRMEEIQKLGEWAVGKQGIRFATEIKLPDGSNATGSDIPPLPNGRSRVFLRTGSQGLLYMRWVEEPGAYGYWITDTDKWIPYGTTHVEVEMTDTHQGAYVEITVDTQRAGAELPPNGGGIYINHKTVIQLQLQPRPESEWEVWKYHPTARNGNIVTADDPHAQNIIADDFQVKVVDPATGKAYDSCEVRVWVIPLGKGPNGNTILLNDQGRQVLEVETDGSNYGLATFKVPMKHVLPWYNSGFVVVAEYYEEFTFGKNRKRDEVAWYFNEQ